MRTQINTLLSGTKSQLLNSSIDYSTFPKATSHLGHAGTKHEVCDNIWNELVKENPEKLKVEIFGEEIELEANWSLSGKSVDYFGTVDADFAINKLGLTENNTNNGVSITISFSNIITVSYGKKAHFYICPSLITII